MNPVCLLESILTSYFLRLTGQAEKRDGTEGRAGIPLHSINRAIWRWKESILSLPASPHHIYQCCGERRNDRANQQHSDKHTHHQTHIDWHTGDWDEGWGCLTNTSVHHNYNAWFQTSSGFSQCLTGSVDVSLFMSLVLNICFGCCWGLLSSITADKLSCNRL